MEKKRTWKDSGLWDFWVQFRKNRLALFGLALLCIIILFAVFAPIIAPEGYDKQDLTKRFLTPSREHLMGTDNFGRDIFARIIYGARISLVIGLGSMMISVCIGMILGAISGYYGGYLDQVIMRIMDIFLSIPQLILAIAIAAALGGGIGNLILAVSLSSIPRYARILRGSVLQAVSQEYVEAAKAGGASDFRILLKHIIPNCLGPIIVQATLGVGVSILSAASLSFIGMGIAPPKPEWGSMLSVGRTYIRDYPHITLFPGLAIAITIFALNVVGDGLRDAFDPKQRR
ncbi:MAG: ABC transporter permease [Tissierellia bacterium]|nr:ABC transporter permease [Tissierellia bacterium]